MELVHEWNTGPSVACIVVGMFSEGESRGVKRNHEDEENANDA